MKQSTDRILTTHVGSLIRPAPLQELLRAKQAGKSCDQAAYEACLKSSVAEVVRNQAEVGVDVVSDGEFGKSISWSQYVLERLSGFERRPIKSGANPFTRGVDREPLWRVLRRARRARGRSHRGGGGLRGPDQLYGGIRTQARH
jgi:5-methyltetrahydropteroyltriglutamate--homocysteine methyltransferase